MITYRYNQATDIYARDEESYDSKIVKLLKTHFPSDWKLVNDAPTIDIIFGKPAKPYSYEPSIRIRAGHLAGKSRLLLTEKGEFYKRFQEYSWIPPTEIVTIDTVPAFRTLRILKPTQSWHGSGNQVVETAKQAREWIASQPAYSTWALQKYIRPSLFQSRKFHLRIYALVVCDVRQIKHIWLSNRHLLVSAKQKYKESDFENVDIHDTHYSTEFTYTYPDNLPDGWDEHDAKRANKKLQAIVGTIFEKEPHIHSDWRVSHSFEVFGIDVLFDETKKPFILEINRKTLLRRSKIIPFFPSFLQHGIGDFVGVDMLKGTPDTMEQIL